MNKYVLKVNRDRTVSVGEYISKQEAVQAMERIIIKVNKGLSSNDKEYLTPFDFLLDVVERDVNEEIDTFDKASRYIGLEKSHVSDVIRRLISELNIKHVRSLIAFNQLCTIAEAWNKADGFEPDFSNKDQERWLPWFVYSEDAAGFMSASTHNAASSAHFGSRLCFKTPERAEQFGKQFIDLWNEVFL